MCALPHNTDIAVCAARQAARTSLKAFAGDAGHPGQLVLHSCHSVRRSDARHSDQQALAGVRDALWRLVCRLHRNTAAPVYAANLLSKQKFDFEPEGDDRVPTELCTETTTQHNSRAAAGTGRSFKPPQSSTAALSVLRPQVRV